MQPRVASPQQQLNEWRRVRACALHQEGWSVQKPIHRATQRDADYCLYGKFRGK